MSLIVGESKVDYSIFLFRRKLEVSGVFFFFSGDCSISSFERIVF